MAEPSGPREVAVGVDLGVGASSVPLERADDRPVGVVKEPALAGRGAPLVGRELSRPIVHTFDVLDVLTVFSLPGTGGVDGSVHPTGLERLAPWKELMTARNRL